MAIHANWPSALPPALLLYQSVKNDGFVGKTERMFD
jgi:hypothetical protein